MIRFLRRVLMRLMGRRDLTMELDIVVSPSDRTVLDKVEVNLVVRRGTVNPILVGDVLLLEGYTERVLVLHVIDNTRVVDISTMETIQLQTVATIVGGPVE